MSQTGRNPECMINHPDLHFGCMYVHIQNDISVLTYLFSFRYKMGPIVRVAVKPDELGKTIYPVQILPEPPHVALCAVPHFL